MEKRFEQRDPPTEDKVIQIDVGDQKHPKAHIYKRKFIAEREARPYSLDKRVYRYLCLEL